MSAVVSPVAPVSISTSTPQPLGGATVTSGAVALTSPSLQTTPVVIAPVAGSTSPVVVAMATQGAQAVIQSSGGQTPIQVGLAKDSAGNPLSISGSVVQASDASTTSIVVNYQGAVLGGTKVNGNIDLGGSRGGVGTIADNAPPGTFNGTPDTYIQTGAGNDQIAGTDGIDFIRAGAGDDAVNAGAGDDIIRMGSGNDVVTMGQGDDVAYLTVDQLQGNQIKTITDFKVEGSDKIQISQDLQGLVSITGQGTKEIVITLSGAQTGTTTIASNGREILGDDIQFV